ncbi:TraC family protein [Candidatus Microgenomates bacterium]|nr:TraC family protein [Candidatus Microgenomates bacterium]
MADNKTQKNITNPSLEASTAKSTATQSFLDIDQIREGILILKDGSMKAVLMCSAVNFELKSEIERDSIIYGYQSFLNSLDFPIQIVLQSRRLDLDVYLKTIEERKNQESNELLRTQMAEYINYVRELITQSNIMQKRFFVVISHYPAGVAKIGGMSRFFGAKGTVAVNNFVDERKYLMQKVATTASGLQGVGIKISQLVSQDLIELFYGTYNPDQAVTQKLIDPSQMEAEIIEKLPEEMEIG